MANNHKVSSSSLDGSTSGVEEFFLVTNTACFPLIPDARGTKTIKSRSGYCVRVPATESIACPLQELRRGFFGSIPAATKRTSRDFAFQPQPLLQHACAKTLWPHALPHVAGLAQAPVRKRVGSNPAAVSWTSGLKQS